MRIFNYFKITTSIAFLFFIIIGCKHKKEENNDPQIKIFKDEILLSDKNIIESKLKYEKVKNQSLKSELIVNGTVKVIPNQFAQISSPFAGRIVKSFINLGQTVKKGDAIFEISSSDFFQAQQEYYSAQQELAQSELNLKRQKDLYAHAVGVKKELEEAQTDYNLKKIALNQLAASLKVFSSKNKLGQSLIIRSPINGKIVQNDLVIGQYLKEDQEPLVTVAELSKVWISAQVKENDLGILNQLKDIKFTINAFPNQTFDGRIINIGQLLNEETRSVDVTIETINNQSILKPGMFVNVQLNDAPKEEIILPTKAIFQEHDSQYVFVTIGKRKFKKVKIKAVTNTNNSDYVHIISGLKEGDNVVIDGGIYLMGAK